MKNYGILSTSIALLINCSAIAMTLNQGNAITQAERDQQGKEVASAITTLANKLYDPKVSSDEKEALMQKINGHLDNLLKSTVVPDTISHNNQPAQSTNQSFWQRWFPFLNKKS